MSMELFSIIVNASQEHKNEIWDSFSEWYPTSYLEDCIFMNYITSNITEIIIKNMIITHHQIFILSYAFDANYVNKDFIYMTPQLY